MKNHKAFILPLIAVIPMLYGAMRLHAQQQYQLYNGRNYRYTSGSGRSYRPCLAYYPVDMVINMNSGAPGDAITVTNLANGIQGAFTVGTLVADINAIIGTSFSQLQGSLHVQGETGDWGCGWPTQTMMHNNKNQKSTSEIHYPTDHNVVRIDGVIFNGARSPFDSNVTMDNVTTIARGSHSMTIQLQNSPVFHCADDQGILTGVSLENSSVPAGGTTTHSPCLELHTNGHYYYTMITDNTTAKLAKMNMYDLDLGPPSPDTQVGGTIQVVIDATVNGAYFDIRYGNDETAYSVGTFTGFQFSMVSWTDLTWPNIPH